MLSVLALFGVGCFSRSPESSPNPTSTGSNPPPTADIPSESPISTPPVATSTPPLVDATSTPPLSPSSTLFSVDDTWQTYANRALGFEFRWPTKGSYTPTWEVKFYPASDSHIKDECFVADDAGENNYTERTTVDGVRFCHTSYSEGAAGSGYYTDYFITPNGKQFVAVILKKQVFSAGALNCSFVSEYPYSLSSKNCVPFKPDEYRALLNTIISTFKYTSQSES